MGRIGRFFGNPGLRPDIHQRAPICVPKVAMENKAGKDTHEEQTSFVSTIDEGSDIFGTVSVHENGWIKTSHGFTGLEKDLTDRILDRLVWIAGTEYIFFAMWVILIIWIILGIVYKGPTVWQVVMQDGQSLQCYFWDTLLMRQQLISAHEQKVICGVIRSRIASFKQLAQKAQIKFVGQEDEIKDLQMVGSNTPIGDMNISGKLPVENWYDKLSNIFSVVIGSLSVMIVFWIGIIIWIICGVIPKPGDNEPPYTGETTGSNPHLVKFSSTWQLYINSATAVVLLVSSMFLQNIRARHDKFITKFVVRIFDADREIEERLRAESGDIESENPAVTIISPTRARGQMIIDFYADVIGTGVGVVIAIGAVVAWLAVGNLMDWDDNWWLIIGTYTGLVGFLDGFVIREVYYRIVRDEELNYEVVAQDDMDLFESLGISCPEKFNGKPPSGKRSLDFRISTWINKLCSSQWSVVFSILVIIGLIIAASVLHWSTTGQLLANTPTMIIEAFFMIVLIQAHNWADCQRRVELTALLGRRQIILRHMDERNIGSPHSDVLQKQG